MSLGIRFLQVKFRGHRYLDKIVMDIKLIYLMTKGCQQAQGTKRNQNIISLETLANQVPAIQYLELGRFVVAL